MTLGLTVTISVSTGSTYQAGTSYSATVTIYDSASNTFTVNSADGAVWYDIPWESVDFDDATQSVSLSNFKLVFDWQTFTVGTADFSAQMPTADFEYGALVNIKFTVNFSSPVAGLEQLIVDDGQVTGVDATTHTAGTPVDLADKRQAALVMDFSNMAFPSSGDVSWTITGNLQGTGTPSLPDQEISIPSNGTPGQVRDAMKLKFEAMGLVVVDKGDTRLIVTAPAGKQLNNITIATNVDTLPAGPSAIADKGGADFTPDFVWKKFGE